jgi:hypothetical protein
VYSLEEQNVRFRLVHLVVLPAQTLRDPKASPLVLPQQLQGASRAVEVVLGDGLEHRLGELDVAVFVVVIVVPVCAHIVSALLGRGR